MGISAGMRTRPANMPSLLRPNHPLLGTLASEGGLTPSALISVAIFSCPMNIQHGKRPERSTEPWNFLVSSEGPVCAFSPDALAIWSGRSASRSVSVSINTS